MTHCILCNRIIFIGLDRASKTLIIQGTRLLAGIQPLDSLILRFLLHTLRSFAPYFNTSADHRSRPIRICALISFFISYEIFFFRMLEKKKKEGEWHTSLLPQDNGHYHNMYCEPDVVTYIFHHYQNYFYRFCIVHAF